MDFQQGSDQTSLKLLQFCERNGEMNERMAVGRETKMDLKDIEKVKSMGLAIN